MLNRVFNVVFNYSLGVFTAVSELCRRRHKTKSLSRSQSLFNTVSFNLSRLSLGVLIGCGLISAPTWAAGGFILQNGKLVYCPTLSTDGTTCVNNPSNVNLSSSDGSTLTWNGTGGFSTSILTATSNIVTPKVTIDSKVLAYNPVWAAAKGGNTGLSFGGAPITPYYGVNSAANVNAGNYYGQGAAGTDAVAIGYSAVAKDSGTIAIGKSSSAGNVGNVRGVTSTDAIAIGNAASSTNLGTIAIGKNASANNAHAIAIGLNAKVVGSGTEHGIAIGGGSTMGDPNSLDKESDAAMAGRNVVAIGYNVRMGEAGHSFGMGVVVH